MATTYSIGTVTVGETVLATDVNTPFTTFVNALNSFDGGNIQTDTIPGGSLQSNSITGTKLVDLTVTAGKIGTGAVTNTKLGTASITSAKMDTSSVVAAAIAAGAVTYAKLQTGVAKIKAGTYTGDGSSTHAVTGVGFTPAFVVITRSDATYEIWFRHANFTAGHSQAFPGTKSTDGSRIASCDTDGFTVGNNAAVNAAAGTYYYLALGTT